ncbi:CBM35 domain-containing protein [Phytoactinopolyspora mesophila]|uniref:Cellulosome protein n=1 Tax=Phytoactinopolyspora mesophila TaxID=2650750 RepID=A0A7K3M2E0_9ACTN|nr:CBM35 domain-containing protein [Phytoactinopolyspora mesophila]NDL57454.1 cellulosome protein [Phytoactinopolyspora mesophila]
MRRWITLVATLSVVAGTVTAVTTSQQEARADGAQELRVDLGQRTGEFFGAGSGVLYGLSDDGVPSDNTLEPLRMHSIAQKPPAGAQHPNGDSLVVAEPFFRTGGEYIQIYVQDMFEEWEYENPGGVVPCNDVCFDVYMEKLAWVVDQVVDSPHADRFVYVPFNEPDHIWYGLGTGNNALYQQRMAVFLEHWKTAVEYIRENHPGARVVGMNDATFRERNYRDFLTFARDNDVLPDITAWHQLPSNSLEPSSSNYFRNTYEIYRGLEQEFGITARPIDINEYGGNRDLTVPGQLIQWVAMFEEAKVAAGGKAYWTAAGGLAGDVVQTNKPGGGWWFYKMYADLHGGETVQVTRPDTTSLDALDAIGVVDDERRQARVVAGGTAGDFDVVLDNVDTDLFGDTVHVALSATTWSGQNSDAPPPVVLLEEDFVVDGGTVTVPVRGLGVHGDGGPNVDLMAAYEIVVSPGGNGTREAPDLPWRASYEAEDATIESGQVYTQGTPQNWNTGAASGNRDVGSLNQEDSSVTFEVEVPEAGEYRLGIMYGNQTGQPSQQVLTVNGDQAQFVDYEATMSWVWRTRKDVTIELQEGANEIRLATSHPELGRAVGEATLDRIDLERITSDGPVTRRYEAENSQTSGNVAFQYDRPDQSGAGYIELKRGGEALFAVYAEEDGYYDLEFRHNSPGRPGSVVAEIGLDRRPVDGGTLRAAPGGDFWSVDSHRLFLSAGVNRVTVEPAGAAPVRLDALNVTRAVDGELPVQSIEAEDAELGGSAAVEAHSHASGGHYVGWVGQGPENRVTFEVEADRAGEHLLVVHYAHDERDEGHPYNTDIVSRPIDISVNGGESNRFWFKNTWSWGNWWARGVPVTLDAGTNEIALYNDPANSATAEGCPAPCMPVLDSEWAPNLDKFEIAPIRIE